MKRRDWIIPALLLAVLFFYTAALPAPYDRAAVIREAEAAGFPAEFLSGAPDELLQALHRDLQGRLTAWEVTADIHPAGEIPMDVALALVRETVAGRMTGVRCYLWHRWTGEPPAADYQFPENHRFGWQYRWSCKDFVCGTAFTEDPVLLEAREGDHSMNWNCPVGVAGGWAAAVLDPPYEGLAGQPDGSFVFEFYHPGQAFGQGWAWLCCRIAPDGTLETGPVIISPV